MASSYSRKLVRAGLAVAVAVLVLLATEGAVRLLGIAPQLQLQYPRMVPDPYLPFRPPANATYVTREPSGDFELRVRTNSAGFRDTEHAIPKPPGVFRIVALGDSFTFGTGARFEETYLARLERLLNRRQGGHPTVEIVKAGLPRFYTEPERLLLKAVRVTVNGEAYDIYPNRIPAGS